MRIIRRFAPVGVALALTLGAQAASAAPLLRPNGAGRGRGSLAGVGLVQRLALDRAALAALRREAHAVLRDFPLGATRTVDLTLERFDPFTPGAHAEVMEASGPRTLALPDQVYFTGSVTDEPDSRVLLIAAPARVHGFVISRGEVYPFGPDPAGIHRGYALRDVDPTIHPPPRDFCANDLVPGGLQPPPTSLGLDVAPPPPVAGDPALKQADIAIETDRELRLKFGTDQEALDYLASLAAAATAIYEQDVFVRLRFSYIRLWGAAPADPWSASDTSGALTEFRNYWNNAGNGMSALAGPRTVAHMISGKPVAGGIAYVDVLCNQQWAYGVSQVNGSFNLAQPSQIWDVVVFTHELGHNFGSPHTHCYNPPVDRCYNGESGCYSGSVVASRGTIMSYCHLLGGGLTNIDLVFGSTVSTRIGQSVANAGCLTTVPSTTTTTVSGSSTTTSTSSTLASTTSTSTTSSTVTTKPSTTSTSSSSTSSSTSTSTTSSSTSTSSTSTSSSTSSSSSSSSSSTTTSTSTSSSSSSSLPGASTTTSTSSTLASTSTSTSTTSSTVTTAPSTTSSSSSTTTSSSTSSSSSTTSSSTTTSTSTSSTSATTPSSTTSSSTSASTTSTLAGASTSTTIAGTTTTSTTVPGIASGDGDGDAVPDASDACTGTPPGDLVDASGCSVCPCLGPTMGGTWLSRGTYVRCVRTEAHRRLAAAEIDRHGLRAALRHARRGSCARRRTTRCCVYRGDDDRDGTCRLLPAPACAARGADGLDRGPGSCLPSPCAR